MNKTKAIIQYGCKGVKGVCQGCVVQVQEMEKNYGKPDSCIWTKFTDNPLKVYWKETSIFYKYDEEDKDLPNIKIRNTLVGVSSFLLSWFIILTISSILGLTFGYDESKFLYLFAIGQVFFITSLFFIWISIKYYGGFPPEDENDSADVNHLNSKKQTSGTKQDMKSQVLSGKARKSIEDISKIEQKSSPEDDL